MTKVKHLIIIILTISILLLIVSTAHARRGGVKITNKNKSLVVEISDSLACMFRPNKAYSIPGTVQTRGSNNYFLPRKQLINQKLKRMKARGKSKDFIKKRKQKLIRQMKKLRERCNEYRIIRRAVQSTLDNATSPDGTLDSFLDLAVELLDGVSDLRTEYKESLAILFTVFSDKEDFDNLSDAMQNAESLREIEPASSSSAQIDEVSNQAVECDEEETHLYFVPGVNTDIFTTFMQATYLREYIKQENPTALKEIAVRIWFNKSSLPTSTDGEICQLFVGPAASATPIRDNSTSIDLLPTSMQNLAEAYDNIFQNCIDAYGISASSVQSLSDWRTSAAAYTPDAAEVSELKNQIALDIQSGRKVILIGHSQGNKLIESVVNSLGTDGDGDLDDSLGVLAVAPPFTFTGSGGYGDFTAYTMGGDLTTDVTGAPASNLTNDLSSDTNITPETHRLAQNDLVLSYLGDNTNGSMIVNEIITQSEDLMNGREFVGQGFFQVSLSWDIDGDIDLHVFEPNGAHVLWSSKQGIVGQLDRDDIPGDGPENYFVCDRASMETGTFKVQVNNYGGTTGTLATITIRGKFTTNTYTVTMDAANSGSVLLDVAEVTYGGDGSFTFTDTRAP